jgi:DNA-binding transcriptional LysR family regulator
MTLRHIHIFLQVVRCGSMTKGADALGMAQPPVSQAIAELEKHYGTPLFERRGRGVVPTPAGDLLASYVSHVEGLIAEAENRLRDFVGHGDLRIGASRTTGTALLPQACVRFKEMFPQATLQLLVDNTARVVERLEKAELDVALVEGLVENPAIHLEPLSVDRLVLVCGPQHPWAGGQIEARELKGQSFLVREPGSGTREVFAAAMEARGLSWNLAGEIGGVSPLLALVQAGLGLAFLSERTVRDPLSRRMVFEVQVADLEIRRQFSLAIHGNRLVTPALEAFGRAARQAATA